MKAVLFNTEQEIKNISSLIYKLMYPEDFIPDGERYLFGWGTYQDKWVALIDESLECPIFDKATWDSIIAEIASILEPYLVPNEGKALSLYLGAMDSIILGNIIPQSMTIIPMQDYINSQVKEFNK